MTKKRAWWCVVYLVGLVVAGAALVPPAQAQEGGEELRFSATVDGRSLEDVDPNEALRLQGEQETLVSVTVDNRGDEEIFVRSIRLDGKVMGLTFFSYETRVDLRVPPGETGEREFAFDLIDLGSQANGLLPARMALLDGERQTLAGQSFPADVRGSLLSIYGVFGLAVAAITAVLLIAAIVRLATHRLSPNRWRRGIRFGVPGLGLGLTLTFTLSTLRVLTPSPSGWVTLVVIFGAALFIIGFCTPTPEAGDEDDDEDDGILADDYEGIPTTRRPLAPLTAPGNTTVQQGNRPPPPPPR
jgi:hypothetical protein